MGISYLFKADALKEHCIKTFMKFNVPEPDAQIAAEILISADLRGVDSHGIIRLHTYYTTRLRKGLINPASPISVLRETITSVALDGGSGLGQVVSYRAMEACIAKARESGMAIATVRNSNHYGIAGYYAMMALPEDMIGVSFTNSQPLVAPTYGRKPMLGTNPIAVAVPAGKEYPYVLDMATSIVPIGRITVYEKAGKEIPLGWGVDSDGNPTPDPSAVLAGGALMPLGGIDLMRGYKGYGLGLLVDIFSGVLAGAAFASEVGQPHGDTIADVGHFFAAIKIDSIRPIDEFKNDMDRLVQMLKESPKAVGQDRIYIAGEKEFERAERFSREGVPLLSEVVKSLKQAGEEVGVPFNLQPIGEIQTK
ncbi:MAG TPA: Ldh family oxidoreductase [Anaerolineaceae bacterium]